MPATGDLRFDSWAGQIVKSDANGLPPLQHFFKEAVLPKRNDAEMGPENSTLLRSTASLMKKMRLINSFCRKLFRLVLQYTQKQNVLVEKLKKRSIKQ